MYNFDVYPYTEHSNTFEKEKIEIYILNVTVKNLLVWKTIGKQTDKPVSSLNVTSAVAFFRPKATFKTSSPVFASK